MLVRKSEEETSRRSWAEKELQMSEDIARLKMEMERAEQTVNKKKKKRR